MKLLDFFLSPQKKTANIAKKRLQIIVAEQRRNSTQPDYWPLLKNELLKVISKYVKIKPEMLTVELEHKRENISIMALNITLPE